MLLPVLALALVLFMGVDAFLWLRCARFIDMGKEALNPSFGDCFAALFSGSLDMATLDVSRMGPPMGWIAITGLFLYAPLAYPYSNLMGFGKQLLVRGQSRWCWWLGKCLWVVGCVAVTFVVALVAALVVSAAAGGEPTLAVQANLPNLLSLNSREFLEAGKPVGPFMAQVATCLTALCLVQLALSLALRPLISYLLVMGIVVLSAFFSGFPFVGELCMWARVGLAVPSGVEPAMGIAASLTLAVVAVAVGGLHFSKMDIMDKELNQ